HDSGEGSRPSLGGPSPFGGRGVPRVFMQTSTLLHVVERRQLCHHAPPDTRHYRRPTDATAAFPMAADEGIGGLRNDVMRLGPRRAMDIRVATMNIRVATAVPALVAGTARAGLTRRDAPGWGGRGLRLRGLVAQHLLRGTG